MALAEAVAKAAANVHGVDLAVCPPFCYLDAVGRAIAGSKVALGAQNMYHQPDGAFTGEISAAMLCDLGCRYVILGHSERRHILGETDAEINKKVHAALAAGLTAHRLRGRVAVRAGGGPDRRGIRRQFAGSLAGLSAEQMLKIVIAYEPVWAIGTGKVATPAQAEEVHLDLRKIMAERYNEERRRRCGSNMGGASSPTTRPNCSTSRISTAPGGRRQPESRSVHGHCRRVQNKETSLCRGRRWEAIHAEFC